MTTVFLSYSTKDHHFAELVTTKLAEAGIQVWRDQGRLRAGTDWRQEIERAISSADAVIVAMSTNSADSAYVTFEWAYALGNGSDLVPIKLNECNVHPRLQTIQHLDFSVPGSLPWETLVERIREIDKDVKEKSAVSDLGPPVEPSQPDAVHVRAVLAYLSQRGYQALSFERVRQRIDVTLTDIKLNELIANNPTLIRHARLKTGKPGVARVQP